jgi:hypothetical protein
MASVDSQSYTFLAEMNGFPVVNPDDFEPPADYRRQPMPGGQ